MPGEITNKNKPKEVNDIFAETESNSATGSTSSSVANRKRSIPPPTLSEIETSGSRQGSLKKFLVIGLVIIVVLAGAIFAWWFFSRSSTNLFPSNQNQQSVAGGEGLKNTGGNYINKEIDADTDGLTNKEEKELGTNPNKADSDDDSLLDFEEVKIYQTDPLNPDTDGDGHKDGEEVKNGYNPKGEGRLYEVPKE